MSEAERGGASRRDESGRLLAGRYRLGGVLGRGGMGTVWRAKDETLGRTVAVKELRFPSSIDEDEKRRLITRTLREAKAIARIRSNGAVTVFDVVDEDDRPWIVMELIEGKSLAEVIREDGLLEPKRAAEVGLAILDVLRAAHRQGILHRDVKPSNVLISKEDGRVVLTDFGIAQVEGDPSITSTGMLVGAPSYISPERARGHKPGPAADLWSLGGLLYASVEGVPPYDKGSAIATLTAVMTEPVPEPKSAGPLKDVIFGLLAKDPQQRLDDAGARALLNDVIHAPEPKEAEPEPLDATRVVALPPVPEERSGKGTSGGSGSGARQGEGAERWRGALRSVRKAASGAVAGTAAAGARGRAGEESGSGASSSGGGSGSGSGLGSGSGSGSGSDSGSGSGSGSGSKGGSRPGSSAGSTSGSGAVSAAEAGAGSGSGAGKGTAAGTAVSERSTDKTFDKFSGKSADESGAPSGQSGESGGDASGGKASAGRTGEGDVAATKAVGTVAGGRTSGWPEMTPPDLPPRPVPRAPITDVVPRRTLVIVAVVVALAVLGTVLALSFGGDDGASGSRSGDTKSAAAGKATPSSGKDEDSAASTENEQTEAASGTDASASGEAGTESGSGGSSGSGSGGDTSGSDSAAETTYKGSQGFRIGLPKGWKYQSTDAAGARFSGPDGQKLLVAWTSTPKNDPVADWKNQERYMTRSQYQRIRIEEVDYRDWKTADWEFTYTDGGTKYRSIDRGFVVNSQQGYALMYTAKASEWSSDLRKDTWRTFTKTFQPKS